MPWIRSINRLVAAAKPNQAFLNWLNTVSDNGVQLSLEEARDDSFVFLVPEYDTNEEAKEYILSNSREPLELILESWHTDEDTWPDQLDRRLFMEWFEVEVHSEVVDLVDREIEHEPF
jgi:hypothetical protein